MNYSSKDLTEVFRENFKGSEVVVYATKKVSSQFKQKFLQKVRELLGRIPIKAFKVEFHIYSSLNEVSGEESSFIEEDQSTIIRCSGGHSKTLIIEENWLRRGEAYWKAMMLETISYSFTCMEGKGKIIEEYLAKFNLKEAYELSELTHKACRSLKVNNVLFKAGFGREFSKIITEMINWRINYLEISKLLSEKEFFKSPLTYLTYIYPLIISHPFRNIDEIEEAREKLMNSLPLKYKRITSEMLGEIDAGANPLKAIPRAIIKAFKISLK